MGGPLFVILSDIHMTRTENNADKLGNRYLLYYKQEKAKRT